MCGNAERVLCGAMERDRSKCDAACAYERIETRYVYNTNQRNGTKLVISFYVWISEYNKNKTTNNNSVRGSRRTKITVHCEYAVPAFVIIIFAAFSLLMCFIFFSSAPASPALSLSLWLDELEFGKDRTKKCASVRYGLMKFVHAEQCLKWLARYFDLDAFLCLFIANKTPLQRGELIHLENEKWIFME